MLQLETKGESMSLRQWLSLRLEPFRPATCSIKRLALGPDEFESQEANESRRLSCVALYVFLSVQRHTKPWIVFESSFVNIEQLLHLVTLSYSSSVFYRLS